MWSGTEKNLNVTVVDGSGNPINLTNTDLDWRMSEEPYTSSIKQLYSTGSTAGVGSTALRILSSTAGTVRISLLKADTANLVSSKVYFHRLNVTDGTLNISTVLTGWGTIYYGKQTT